MNPQKESKEQSLLGKPLDRVDGRLKVTGEARYAADFSVPNMAYAVLVQSTFPAGTITRIDKARAIASSGVIAVLTSENVPKEMSPPTTPPSGESYRLLDSQVYFSGQSIAVVVAETLEQAERGALLVTVEYEATSAVARFEEHLDKAFIPGGSNRPPTSKRGDFDSAVKTADAKIEQIYRTPTEHHNPMEPHATLSVWNGDNLTVYDSTQGVSTTAQNLAEQFGLLPEQVHVINPFVGGGFGCKGQSWLHVPISAMSAKVVGRPVKLVLTRRQLFTSNGHRPPTRQEVVYATDKLGKLVAIRHHNFNHTSERNLFMEPSGTQAATTYSCPNVDVEHKLVRVNVGSPTFQRAPGESSGSFSIESSMDELAWQLGIDPIELRLRNYAEKDESVNKPYSSKSLKECYSKCAEAFGWSKRIQKVGGMRDGKWLVGYGMSTATYPASFRASSAKALMYEDGTVRILCGTQDIGTGTYTILTQIAADAIKISPGQVRVNIGDSSLPSAPGSGGSCSAASAGSAVHMAAQGLRGKVIGYATGSEDSVLSGLNSNELEVKDGRISSKKDPTKTMTYAEIMKKYNKKVVVQEAFAEPGVERGVPSAPIPFGSPPPELAYSMQGFGAHFCEVHVDPNFGMVRVVRWTGAFACGKILNEKTARSQFQGGIIWGIGMGLMEESLLDDKHARYVNTNLAEYHVPVNLDVPPIEIIMVDENDSLVNPIGVKGVGEIGVCGAAAAIGNAVYHATGKRVRDLPITLDKLL